MFHPAALIISTLLAYASGASDASPSKIVGGTLASISAFPYQVSLQINGIHFCGGLIYNSRTIVTAAHCVETISTPTQIKIRYGSSYWAKGGTLVGVSKLLIHPNFNGHTLQNDIAILKTTRAIVRKANVKYVLLADNEPENNTMANISGWGTQKSGATTIPSQLRSASVKIISRAVCKSKQYGYGTSVSSTMICARSDGIDSCQGDSGGPLIVGGMLVGIVSWGSGCAASYYPGVYSSVAVLKSFVTTNANKL